MSIWSTVSNYINENAIKPLMKLVGAEGSESTPAKTEQTNSVFTQTTNETNAEKTGDSYEKSPEAANSSPQAQQEEPSLTAQVGQLKATVQVQCQKNGIEFEEALKFLGLSPAGFNKLTEDNQRDILAIIGVAIQEAEQYIKANGKSDEVDVSRIVLESMAVMNNGIKKGIYKNAEDYKRTHQDISQEMEEDEFINSMNKLPKGGLTDLLNTQENRMNKYYERQMARISRLPEEQRKVAEAKLNQKMQDYREYCYNRVLITADTEKALEAATIGTSNQYTRFVRRAIDTRKTPALRMKAADYSDMHMLERAAEIYYERGDALKPRHFREYNTFTVSEKSYEGVQEHQRQYVEMRNKFEQEGYPEYFTSEMFTESAIGIGIGATVNGNMTTEQKAEFLNTWDNDAKQYSDYETVIQGTEEGVQQYIEEHQEDLPNLSNEVTQVKAMRASSSSQQSNSNNNNNTDNNYANDKKGSTRNYESSSSNSDSESSSKSSSTTYGGSYAGSYSVSGNGFYATTPSTLTGVIEGDAVNIIQNSEITNNSNNNAGTILKPNDLKKATDKQIEACLSSGTLSFGEVKKILGEDKAFKIVFASNELLAKHHNEAINYVTNQKDESKLAELAKTNKGIDIILTYNRANNKEKLVEELKKKANSTQKYLFKKFEKAEDKNVA